MVRETTSLRRFLSKSILYFHRTFIRRAITTYRTRSLQSSVANILLLSKLRPIEREAVCNYSRSRSRNYIEACSKNEAAFGTFFCFSSPKSTVQLHQTFTYHSTMDTRCYDTSCIRDTLLARKLRTNEATISRNTHGIFRSSIVRNASLVERAEYRDRVWSTGTTCLVRLPVSRLLSFIANSSPVYP